MKARASSLMIMIALAWLGHAYRVVDDEASARLAFARAEAMFPDSAWLDEVEHRR